MTKLRVSYWIDDDDRSSGANTNTIDFEADTQTLLYNSDCEEGKQDHATSWLRSCAETQIHKWQTKAGYTVGKVFIHKIWIP